VGLEPTLAAVLAAVVALLILAQFLRVPYPILLVVGGLGIALVPGIPRLALDPDLVLVVLLPPLLYAAAFFTPLRELRRNVRSISLLAVGLVLATALIVAAVVHSALGFAWPEAFVLGAVVSPTDPTAATAIARRVGVPARIATIIEGESLINDATALVIYKFAIAATLSGVFSLPHALLSFVVDAAGGIAIGAGVGAVIAAIRYRLDNPPVEVTIALFTGYFAYLPAEAIGVSGVLAAVTVGIFMGRLTSKLTTPTTRIQGDAVWEILVFVMNSALFVLVGMQLPNVLDGIGSISTATLIRDGAIVAATVMAVRVILVFPLAYGPRFFFRRIRERDPYPAWQAVTIIAWTGMRGAVSLAAALALPLVTNAGAGFPHREEIIFLAFCVILGTLVIQGLSLPALVHLLGVEDDTTARDREESKARVHATRAALARIDELASEDWVRDETAERVRRSYDYRLRRFSARFEDPDGDAVAYEERSAAYQRLVREIIDAQRRALLELRAKGAIDDDLMHAIERELDYEDSRLEI
jgi:CPA1 family monovalent cation:H+ antiporter